VISAGNEPRPKEAVIRDLEQCSQYILKTDASNCDGSLFREFPRALRAFACWPQESAPPIWNCSADITVFAVLPAMNSSAK
jgi:hypothetical protein